MKEIMNQVYDMSSKFALGGIDIIAERGSLLGLKSFNGAISEHKVSSSQIIGVRVIKENRCGVSYTESFDKDSLAFMLQQAVNSSKFTKVNPHEMVQSPGGEKIQIEANHNQDESATLEEKMDATIELEKGTFKVDPSVKNSPYNGISEVAVEHASFDGHTFTQQKQKYLSAYTSALCERGEEKTMFWHSQLGRKMADIDFQKIINESVNTSVALLDVKKIESGQYPILFSPDMLESFTGIFFGSILSSKSAIEGTNPLKDKLGQMIASNQFTLIDDPTFQDSFFPSLFDAEGFDQKPITLIDRGEFKEMYTNTATAKELGQGHNCRASRSVKGTLMVNGTTLVIAPGKESEKNLLKGRYVELVKLDGLHSGAEAVSGSFSFGASGFLCENGERLHALKNFTVSGNFYEAMKNITAMGDQLHTTADQSFFAPSIIWGGITLAFG